MLMMRFTLLFPSVLAVLALASCREAEAPLSPAAPAAPAVAPAPAAVEPEATLPPSGELEQMAGICNIESIDNQSGEAMSAPVRVLGNSTVSGWRALVSSDGTMAPAWLRVTQADGSVAYQALLPGTEDRPDVSALLGNPATLASGFRDVAIEGLQPGSFTLEVVFNSADGWVRCAHARALVVE